MTLKLLTGQSIHDLKKGLDSTRKDPKKFDKQKNKKNGSSENLY